MTKNCRMELLWIEARKIAKMTIKSAITNIDRDTLEDMVQISVIKASEKYDMFDDKKSSFKVWMSFLAKNTAIDYLRKNKLWLGKAEWDENLYINESECYMDIELLEIKANEAFLALREKERKLIELRYLRDLSYSEIEQITGVKANSLATYTMRARRSLQSEFKRLYAHSAA